MPGTLQMTSLMPLSCVCFVYHVTGFLLSLEKSVPVDENIRLQVCVAFFARLPAFDLSLSRSIEQPNLSS